MKENNLNMSNLTIIIGKAKLKTIGVFYQRLFNALEEGNSILLIKHNHRNTYNHLNNMANIMNKNKELVNTFKLIEVEMYNHKKSKIFTLVKQMDVFFDMVFIEKVNYINDYDFIENLKLLSSKLKKILYYYLNFQIENYI